MEEGNHSGELEICGEHGNVQKSMSCDEEEES